MDKCQYKVWDPITVPKWPHMKDCGHPAVTTVGTAHGDRFTCVQHLEEWD